MVTRNGRPIKTPTAKAVSKASKTPSKTGPSKSKTAAPRRRITWDYAALREDDDAALSSSASSRDADPGRSSRQTEWGDLAQRVAAAPAGKQDPAPSAAELSRGGIDWSALTGGVAPVDRPPAPVDDDDEDEYAQFQTDDDSPERKQSLLGMLLTDADVFNESRELGLPCSAFDDPVMAMLFSTAAYHHTQREKLPLRQWWRDALNKPERYIGRPVDPPDLARAESIIAQAFDDHEAGRDGRYGLLLIDPLYTIYPNDPKFNENDNGAMGRLFLRIKRMARRLECGEVHSHHYSRGDQSGKDIMDRGAGAGMKERIITAKVTILPNRAGQDAFTLEGRTRSFAPWPAFGVRWQFPCLRRDDGINPADVVNADQKKRNQNDEADLPRLLQHLDKWRSPNYLHSRTGIGPPRVRRMLQPLIDCGDVLQRERTEGRPEYILHRHSDFTETMTDGVTNENARRPPDNEPD